MLNINSTNYRTISKVTCSETLRPFHEEITTSEHSGNFNSLLVPLSIPFNAALLCKPNTNFSLLIYPYFGSNYSSFKRMTTWTSPHELSIIVIFPFDVKNCAISLISCQSSLPDSMYLDTAQLHNHNYTTVCFKPFIFNSTRKCSY